MFITSTASGVTTSWQRLPLQHACMHAQHAANRQSRNDPCHICAHLHRLLYFAPSLRGYQGCVHSCTCVHLLAGACFLHHRAGWSSCQAAGASATHAGATKRNSSARQARVCHQAMCHISQRSAAPQRVLGARLQQLSSRHCVHRHSKKPIGGAAAAAASAPGCGAAAPAAQTRGGQPRKRRVQSLQPAGQAGP
jgi:hypothetical protein